MLSPFGPLATSTTACAGQVFGSMPKSNATEFGADGAYKVCVKLVDAAGNTAPAVPPMRFEAPVASQESP